MSGLKRKSTDSPSSSVSKPAKKLKVSAAPAKAPLSQELVIDSSDDETVQNSRNAKKAASKSAERRDIGDVAKPSKTPAPTSKAAKPHLHPSKKRKHGNSVSISPASGSSTSEESESERDAQANSGSKAERPIASVSNTSGEETDSPTESGRSDESRSDSDEDESGLGAKEIVSSPAPQEPPPPYDPPPGFKAVTITPSTKIQDLFSDVNLRGKQIWHITAPKSVPISSIKEVSIEKVSTGGSIMSHDGADYGLVTEADDDGVEKVLLVPSPGDNIYKKATARIGKTLHLQEIVKLPSMSDQLGGPVNASTAVPKTHVKTVRQQPEGLRMRYRPFGDDSSSDDADPTSRFSIPPVLTPDLSAKRPRSPKIGDRVPPAKEKREHQHDALDDESRTPNAQRKETAVEKAKRRAEKRRRREQRSSLSKNHKEVDQVREMSMDHEDSVTPEKVKAKKKKENQVAGIPGAVNNSQGDRAEPEKIKTKRKKRKSEVTDDV
ncbi:MAG: hypothetical protein LQ338_003675 [Usnochroma carphineum]|nr:MAG: hypothetical protein LQ338_003675 [Usnochroma carphineum]